MLKGEGGEGVKGDTKSRLQEDGQKGNTVIHCVYAGAGIKSAVNWFYDTVQVI